MKLLRLLIPCLIALAAGCGETTVDGDGLTEGNCAQTLFARAGQLYFRGRLSAALEEFNGVIYRYPASSYASDARLAVRRIETELTGQERVTAIAGRPVIRAEVAVVGKPGVLQGVRQASSGFRGMGVSVSEVSDQQAPELTMVFHAGGFMPDAEILADSLSRWLLRPEYITVRPGEELIEAVAPGCDVMIIIGSDAVFLPEQRGGAGL